MKLFKVFIRADVVAGPKLLIKMPLSSLAWVPNLYNYTSSTYLDWYPVFHMYELLSNYSSNSYSYNIFLFLQAASLITDKARWLRAFNLGGTTAPAPTYDTKKRTLILNVLKQLRTQQPDLNMSEFTAYAEKMLNLPPKSLEIPVHKELVREVMEALPTPPRSAPSSVPAPESIPPLTIENQVKMGVLTPETANIMSEAQAFPHYELLKLKFASDPSSLPALFPNRQYCAALILDIFEYRKTHRKPAPVNQEQQSILEETLLQLRDESPTMSVDDFKDYVETTLKLPPRVLDVPLLNKIVRDIVRSTKK